MTKKSNKKNNSAAKKSNSAKKVNKLMKDVSKALAPVTPTNCPHCNVDLDNNLSTFAEVLKEVGGITERALKLQQKQFACLECDHEWGDEMGPKVEPKVEAGKSAIEKDIEAEADKPIVISKKTGEAVKQYTNHSTVEKPVGKVHALAQEMLGADPAARRKDIVAACVEIGINIHTAKTQVQVYLKGRKDDAAAKLAASVGNKETASA